MAGNAVVVVVDQRGNDPKEETEHEKQETDQNGILWLQSDVDAVSAGSTGKVRSGVTRAQANTQKNITQKSASRAHTQSL